MIIHPKCRGKTILQIILYHMINIFEVLLLLKNVKALYFNNIEL